MSAIEEMGDMDEDMMALEDEPRGPLFWSMKLEPNETNEIEQPAIEGFIVHITNACFGASVQKQSRSVVMVSVTLDDGKQTEEAPICVLRQGSNENQSLDLLFNESAQITVKGTKASPVYLTGYLQPPINQDDADMMNPMMEDMDEEEIQKALMMQQQQQRALDDEEEEEEEEPELIDEAEVEPPTKKQKTAKGAKPTQNGSSPDKKRKTPQSSDDKKEETQKADSKKKGKKDRKYLSMKGGLKYRDMKIGNGAVVKNGAKLRVKYVGQTDDGKVFDKCLSGSGFEFNFGKGEVIKGWDLGLKGMKVGGKRKLVIPAKLGYGSNGSPPSIPPNATLKFTIELIGVSK